MQMKKHKISCIFQIICSFYCANKEYNYFPLNYKLDLLRYSASAIFFYPEQPHLQKMTQNLVYMELSFLIYTIWASKTEVEKSITQALDNNQ
ncbi:hypothetical protein BpHYR1_050485 [Brachionus plicatilis]|uniref:Uncharacterized protein n=1 Tax=Brachionus plicatilis TaxID=10195 RepID=A0A3M7QC53_BRAPC|nr:hypothetical protein BpHYR1_050485 [Brachionus plicatilis]